MLLLFVRVTSCFEQFPKTKIPGEFCFDCTAPDIHTSGFLNVYWIHVAGTMSLLSCSRLLIMLLDPHCVYERSLSADRNRVINSGWHNIQYISDLSWYGCHGYRNIFVELSIIFKLSQNNCQFQTKFIKFGINATFYVYAKSYLGSIYDQQYIIYQIAFE